MSYPRGLTLHAARTGSLRYGRTTLRLPAPPHAPSCHSTPTLCACTTPPSVTRALFRLLHLAWSAPRTRSPSLPRPPRSSHPPWCRRRAGPPRTAARCGSGRGGGTRTRSGGRRRPGSRCGCARASASTSSTYRPRPGTRRCSGSGGPEGSARARRCRDFRWPSGTSGCCCSWRRVARRSCPVSWSGWTGARCRSV